MTKVSLDISNAVSLVPRGADGGRFAYALSQYSDPIAILPILELIPQLEPFRLAAENLEQQAGRAVIDSEEAYQRGSDFLTVCDDQWQQLEDLRKATKGPVDDYGRLIQAIFVPIQNKALQAKGDVGVKMLAHYKAEEAKRKAAAEAQQRRNEEAAQELAQAAEQRGDTATAAAILDVATAVPVPQRSVRMGGTNTFGKSTHLAKRWTAEVEKPMEVLQAILDGKLPISLIEWKQSELNKVASSLKVEKTINGVKVFQAEGLQQR